MNIDNPAALHFIMQDDIFLLNNEKSFFEKVAGNEKALMAEAVEEDKVTIIVEEPVVTYAKPVIKYRGSNSNGFVILVHYPALEFMHEAHLTALENTLKRMGHELNAAAIVNTASHADIAFAALANELNPQKLVVMGKSALPQDITPINFNKPHKLANCTALYTFSFDEMMDSNENKKAFWEQMKAL